jgi:hypothetical protein
MSCPEQEASTSGSVRLASADFDARFFTYLSFIFISASIDISAGSMSDQSYRPSILYQGYVDQPPSGVLVCLPELTCRLSDRLYRDSPV